MPDPRVQGPISAVEYPTEYDPKLGNPVRNREAACPREDLHTPSPRGYREWLEWAETKSKTHVQRRCPGCTLWSIWVPKAEEGQS